MLTGSFLEICGGGGEVEDPSIPIHYPTPPPSALLTPVSPLWPEHYRQMIISLPLDLDNTPCLIIFKIYINHLLDFSTKGPGSRSGHAQEFWIEKIHVSPNINSMSQISA